MKKVALLAAALILGGCNAAPGDTKTNPTSSLAHTQWVLTDFESSLGVKERAPRYFTLSFNANDQLGGLLACRELQGQYTQSDNLLTISSVAGPKNPSCTQEQSDTRYLTALNTAKTFVVTDSGLSVQLPDGSRLNFIKQFQGCANPITVQGPWADPSSMNVMIVPRDKPIEAIFAKYEKSRPDFYISSGPDGCANTGHVTVNPNTLLELRCDSDIAELIYK